jgi:hypothetical protein
MERAEKKHRGQFLTVFWHNVKNEDLTQRLLLV